MKKIIIFTTSAYLLFMFLVYAGIFRDYSDPVEVIKYYLECMRTREGFLTYSISAPESFVQDASGEIYYNKHRMHEVRSMDFSLLKSGKGQAYVEVNLNYPGQKTTTGIARLQKSNKIWLVKDIKWDFPNTQTR